VQVSIIITTYNAENFIVSTLNSVASQTYKNYEVILIDDGSTDNTKEIIKNFIKKYDHNNKFKLFCEKHIGRANSLNLGIKKANYDWIAILDADDLWNKYKLEIQLKYLKELNLNFLSTKSITFTSDGEVNTSNRPSIRKNGLFTEITMDKLLRRSLINHSSVVFRKELAKYDTSRSSQIDLELWLRLLEEGIKMYRLNIELVYKRFHNDQHFERNNRKRYIFNSYKLKMQYAIRNRKFSSAFFLFLKIPYYFIPPKYAYMILNFFNSTERY